MLKFSACGGLLAAAGENFAVSECYKEDFTLQNERRRRIFLRFLSTVKKILPYKMSAAGENFVVSVYYKGDFDYKISAGKILPEKIDVASRKLSPRNFRL